MNAPDFDIRAYRAEGVVAAACVFVPHATRQIVMIVAGVRLTAMHLLFITANRMSIRRQHLRAMYHPEPGYKFVDIARLPQSKRIKL
jgi:hypothetical protein